VVIIDHDYSATTMSDIKDLKFFGQVEGRKFDQGKPRYGLLPPLALQEMARVLTHGAEKYDAGNWKHVPDSLERYFDALQRHVWAWKMGEKLDPDSGIHHLAHALANVAFLYEHDVKYSKEDNDPN